MSSLRPISTKEYVIACECGMPIQWRRGYGDHPRCATCGKALRHREKEAINLAELVKETFARRQET